MNRQQLEQSLPTINAADYEQLAFRHDPMHDDLNRAITIVKQFIIDNKLIIYGGTAIDMALRLHGDKIYPDDLFPDLDFYSCDNVKHAYELADILYRAGFADTRAINASHLKTMRIDLGGNHFIADISYQPPIIFDVIPWLEYENMRINHPLFQRIDMHSALSFPYDGAPREVIFARWNKDVKRFNMLDKYYPVLSQPMPSTPPMLQMPLDYHKYVFTGAIAYAFMYHEFSKFGVDDPAVIPAKLDVTDVVNVSTDSVEIVSFESFDGTVKYEPLGGIIPARSVTKDGITAYDTHNRLLSVNSVRINGIAFRIVNIQYLLRHYIGLHFARSLPGSDTALAYYQSLMLMITHAETYAAGIASDTTIDITRLPFFPSIQTYGNDNIDLTRQVLLNRMYHELDDVEQFVVPHNYYSGKSLSAGRPHPFFDLSSSEFYRESGARIS